MTLPMQICDQHFLPCDVFGVKGRRILKSNILPQPDTNTDNMENCDYRQFDISASNSKDAVVGYNHQDYNKEEPMQSILNYMNVQCFVTSDCNIYMENSSNI